MKYDFRDYSASFAASARASVLSDPINDGPLPGYYWEVMHFTAWDSDSGLQPLALYLFDSAYLIQLQSAIASGGAAGYIPDFGAAVGAPPVPSMHKVSAESGFPATATWGNFNSQRGGGGTIQHNGSMPRIYLPQRWGLYLVEIAGTISTNPRTLLMRLCLRQFENGCSPDSGW